MSVTVPDKTVIDLDILKSKYSHDSLPHHLWYVALDCKRRRDAFWRHYRRMKLYNNLLSIPLLILSSMGGITTVLQIGNAENDKNINNGLVLSSVASVFTISTAIMAALQRYFRYAERSEHSKNMAKSYARISKRIENNLVLVESAAIKMEPSTFLKFMEEVQKDTESLLQETDDMPKELIAIKKLPYDTMMSEVKSHKNTNHHNLHTPLESSAQGTDDSNDTEYDWGTVESLQYTTRITEVVNNIKNIEARLTKATEQGKVEDLVNLRFELAMLKDSLEKEQARMAKTQVKVEISP